MSDQRINLGAVTAWAHLYLPDPAKRNVLALVEAVEAAEAWIAAADDDPAVTELFNAWLVAQARFDFSSSQAAPGGTRP